MGCFGNCLGDCDNCSACTEASGFTNWNIITDLNGFSLSGTFGDLIESICKKVGYSCDREDETVYDDYEEQTSFNSNLAFSSGLWTSGCLCSEITYTGERFQTRRADRWRFWLSKLISVEVDIVYTSSTTFQLFAYVSMATGATITQSLMIQRRRFDVSGNCNGTGLTYGTPTDPGVLAAPDPAPPCVPILATESDIQNNCPPPPLNTQPDPCINSEFYTKNYSILFPSGYGCTLTDFVATLETLRTEQCCQDFCRQTIQNRNITYESAVIDCDDIPTTIDLAIVGPQGSLTASWRNAQCGLGFFPSFYPADLVYVPPATIQIQLS